MRKHSGSLTPKLFYLMVASLFVNMPCHAQPAGPDNFPSRSIQLMMPFSAGGASDVVARLVAAELSKELGQPVVVVNVVGATGSIGTMQVVRSKPDGYTLLLGTAGSIINNPNLSKDVGYDPLKDLLPVSSLWTQPSVVLVHRESGYPALRVLIADGRKNPDKLNYGSGGVGSFAHLSGGLFASVAGLRMTHVPYKGVGPAVTDLMAKNLDIVFSVVSSLVGNTDRLVGLAVAAPVRSSAAPTVPTSAEAGLPDFIYSSWGGLFAPAGLPPRIAEKLSAAIANALNQDVVRKRFETQGVEIEFSKPAEYKRYIATEFDRGRRLVEAAGLRRD